MRVTLFASSSHPASCSLSSLSFPPPPHLFSLSFVFPLLLHLCSSSALSPSAPLPRLFSLPLPVPSLSSSPCLSPSPSPIHFISLSPIPSPSSVYHSLLYPSLFSYCPPSSFGAPLSLFLSVSLSFSLLLSHSQTGFWTFTFPSTIYRWVDWSLLPSPPQWGWALQMAQLCPRSEASPCAVSTLHTTYRVLCPPPTPFPLRVSVFLKFTHKLSIWS